MRTVIYTAMVIWIASLAGCLWVPDGGYRDARQGDYENGQRGGYEGSRHGGYERDHEESRDHEHR
ncbi:MULTISPECIES: hypothetical protein [Ralstonia solanacearum species complex]|uniref:hypothetical protein n=1 Tax=Ralstonia solanacearum species complex TaxID=3116862 RepID=UPI0008556438|nr:MULTISPECIES: hypothetical protein [Ralstonia solanacearum species complex]AOE88453.1 hypothetical protein LBM341_00135 [Ralstonia solanacearum]MCK4149490.1 hypothetical protein [Ralstonia pseudosolanacearum]NJZ67149.1 hypothetical protein [Ralstonia solanacearum]NJZ79069.1 hypothetical protein [Ralstonia solanacearum]NJZ84424.1 hypothetical protein [Ralstonia solanacearum]